MFFLHYQIELTEPSETPINQSVLAELQRRMLKAEAALREKEEENELLHQRLTQYEGRWSEYEHKMRSMEEVWQKQMRSLQSSLSIAKKSLTLEETPERDSIATLNDRNALFLPHGSQATVDREMSAGFSIINRLTEEFDQRSQVFADDVKFLVEVKSGKVDAGLNPDRELRRLKQNFESWKKDFGIRLREAKVILNKLGSDEINLEKVKRRWWARLNSTKVA
jgi:myosin V